MFVLLQLAGYVALLLWGMHMVQSGIMRAFGPWLRRSLMRSLDSRWKALAAGAGVTALTQSSTATALITSGFISQKLVELVPAIAIVLGANVGSTLIVQLVSFDLSAIAPMLVLGGVIAFKKSDNTRTRDSGRILIGLGLVLLALHAILVTVTPIEEGTGARQVLSVMSSDPSMNVVLGALLTWAAFSSVATVLLTMSLAAAHAVTPTAVLALVLGANIGIIIPQYLGAGSDPEAKRLALANLLIRGAGTLAVLPFLGPAAEALAAIDSSSARQAANFHTIFNVGLALAFIGFLDPLARLCTRLLPSAPIGSDPGSPHYLTTSAKESPGVVIASAQREVLRIADMVESMLQSFATALNANDRKKLLEVRQLDDAIDRLHTTIKSHIVDTTRQQGLSELEIRRCSEILAFTINLEHVGDVLDTSLRGLVHRKIKNRLSLSPAGLKQITSLHERVLGQLRLAITVFLNRDIADARRLMEEKVRMREITQAATDEHLRLLRANDTESIDSSALYVDILRDFKSITGHLASAAYPILQERGELRRSRLLDQGSDDHTPPASLN